jgi:hypothetical protein
MSVPGDTERVGENPRNTFCHLVRKEPAIAVLFGP